MNKCVARIIVAVLMLMVLCASVGCGTQKNDNSVTIYSSAEDYRNEYLLARLKEQFPQYDITIEYMETGKHAAKLLAEGTDTEGDITFNLENGYMQQCSQYLARMDGYSMDIYLPGLRDEEYKIFPQERSSGAIIINMELLQEKGLPEPASYEDLLKPDYKGLISMPNPKTSGTGYMFLKSLVNSMGEEEAFKYFDKLSENILQFTSSGSGPVNSLVSGEAVIGLGMTAQAVTQINEGADLKILYFEEGAPYCAYSFGVIKGKEERQCVREVFEFFYNTLNYENCERYFPEQIYEGIQFEIENYPVNIPYADMSNDTIEEKERLLAKWMY